MIEFVWEAVEFLAGLWFIALSGAPLLVKLMFLCDVCHEFKEAGWL